MVQAAVRELFEEAGIRVKPSQLRFAGNFSERYKYALDNGHFYELILTTRPEVKIDHREVVWAGFMETDDALGLNLNPLVRTYLQKKIDDAAD
jgi:8-oxo-dGTP pyrophosphatase MutT (NUDIX family)